MGKDEIIARILKSFQSGEPTNEIWARQHITDAFEEGFDAGAQSKEEEIEKHVRANTQAIINAGHVVVLESPLWMGELIGAAADAGSSTALKLLFTSVTPCGKEVKKINDVGQTLTFPCGINGNEDYFLCDFCRGCALGREEERKKRSPAFVLLTAQRICSGQIWVAEKEIAEAFQLVERKGRLDAAKEIIAKMRENYFWEAPHAIVWIKEKFGVGE